MIDEAIKKIVPKEVGVVPADPQVLAARFSPDGDYLIAGSFDGRVRRWSVQAENKFVETESMSRHGGWVEAFALHASEPTCVSGDSWGGMTYWRQAPEAEILWHLPETHDGWIRSLAIDRTGKFIASCGLDRQVVIRSTKDGAELRRFKVLDAETFCVRFHPTRDELLCGDMLGRIHRWNSSNGKQHEPYDASGLYLYHRLQEVGGVRTLAFSDDGKSLAAAGTRPKNGATVQGVPTLLLFDYESGQMKQEMSFGAANHCFVHDVVFHPKGFLMAVTSGTPGAGQVVFHAIGEDKPFYTNTKLANCHSLSLHPDGDRFAIATTNRGSNGNGRRLNKEGEYQGNNSPIHVFDFQWEQAAAAR